MKAVHAVWGVVRMLAIALNLYGVPLAAAVLGWMFGAECLLWVLEMVAEDPAIHHAFASSSLLTYGAQSVGALLLFLVSSRYLN